MIRLFLTLRAVTQDTTSGPHARIPLTPLLVGTDRGSCTMPLDVHLALTTIILGQIATGDPGNWVPPWHGASGLPRNALTGRSYRGVNTLALWAAARARGYGPGRWTSYKQWATLGAQVRKGEKGALVVFYKDLSGPDRRAHGADDPGQEATRDKPDRRPLARASFVFHADQVANAPAVEQTTTPVDPTPVFDRFVAATGAVIRDHDEPCYWPARDIIGLPPRFRFTSAEGYSATLAHELLHWTGHASRLDRDLTGRFGSSAYAAEELVAELGSAFVLAGLGIAVTPHPNHARYLASWLPLL